MLRQRSVCKQLKKTIKKNKPLKKEKTRNISFRRLPILPIKVAWNRFPRHLLTIFKALKWKSFLLHSRTSFTHLLTNGFKFEMAGVLWQSLLWCERYLEIPWKSFWSRAWKILARFSHSFTNTFFETMPVEWISTNLSDIAQFPNLTSTKMKSFVQKSIQDKRVFSSYLFTWRCYSVSDLGIVVETKQRTPSALTLFPSFPLMIKKVTDYEKLWPICWYGDWSEGICSSVNDTECSEKKNCECSQCEPNLRPSSYYSSALPQRAIGELWRAKPFN